MEQWAEIKLNYRIQQTILPKCIIANYNRLRPMCTVCKNERKGIRVLKGLAGWFYWRGSPLCCSSAGYLGGPLRSGGAVLVKQDAL